MALTYTNAYERDDTREIAAAKHLDAGDLLLAATSIVAVVAIALAYAGRRTVTELGDAGRPGVTAVVNLNEMTTAAQLDPALRLAFSDAGDRGRAAEAVLAFVAANREEPLRSVAAILSATMPATAIAAVPHGVFADRLRAARERATAAGREPPAAMPVVTPGDLALMKPALTVRTIDEFRAAVARYTALYLAAFAAVALLWRLRRIRGDRWLLGIAHVLTAIGFALLVSRSDPLRDPLLFVRFAQAIAIGCVVMGAVSIASAHRAPLRDLSYIPLAAALALSILVIAFGDGPGQSGAKVNLGPVQPIEAIRLLLALFLAGYFARHWELLRGLRAPGPAWIDAPRVQHIFPVVAGVGAAVTLFFVQRDLGPALLLACGFLALYSVARGRTLAAAVGFAALIASFFAGYLLNISATLNERVQMWLSPWDNGVRGGDQVAQAAWALATGGPLGAGLGLGDTRYLPAGYTDLVLAALGEELGVIGVLLAACLYTLLCWRGLRIARAAATDYEFFLATSLTLFLVIPALVMGAGVLGLLPLTGVVTPFLSYGGSAMTANLAALGMLAVIRTDERAPAALLPFHRPLRWLSGGLIACTLCLIVVFANLQVVRADAYATRAHLSMQGDGVKRYQYNPRLLDVIRRIPRGTVYDRRGLPLATTDPQVLTRARPGYTAAGISIDAACANQPERCYPLGGRTFHLLGDARSRLNWAASNTSFVERDAEDRLRGFDDHAVATPASDGVGPVMVRRDYRELLPLLRHRHDDNHADARAFLERSRDLRLTIDARLQARVADVLASAARRSATGRAAAVVIDPATGDVLAAASYPWPKELTAAKTALAEDDESLLDRARFGLYPPGSTFKLLTAAAALRQGAPARRSTFMCTRLPDGRVGARIPGRTRPIRDDVLDKHPHGSIGMHDAMVSSCNAYFAQLAERVGPDGLLNVAAPFGITLAASNARARVSDTLPQAGYGQGDVLTTPLRMARVAAAFAADGVVHEAGIHPGKRPSQVLLSREDARLIAGYLRDAVLEGTGRSLRNHPVRIAGKTGTAEVAGAPSHAWFAGFAPYGRASARIAVAVVIENAGYGGLAAAPVAGEIVSAAAEAGLIR